MSSWASEAALETSRLPQYQASDEDLEHHLYRLGLQYKSPMKLTPSSSVYYQ